MGDFHPISSRPCQAHTGLLQETARFRSGFRLEAAGAPCLRPNVAGEVGDEMSMILEIYAEPGFLHVNATGSFSLVEAQRTFIEMLGAVAQNKVGKVLLDGRGIVGNPRIMERFFYGEFAAQSVAQFGARGVSPDTKFAYVLKVPVT